ncbi:membrane protein [Gordonia phage Lilbeanie]|uniref:Membrane protein n=1 Tax=Gordonia phage Lilbeanie TaxID=2794947 RepID=A0A7T1KSG3_9CAUD|nr:membrane protein [Gordonia phage Lilbeanie]QPO17163.1 membrane protein [Gordonia phage Lilbeanie]
MTRPRARLPHLRATLHVIDRLIWTALWVGGLVVLLYGLLLAILGRAPEAATLISLAFVIFAIGTIGL